MIAILSDFKTRLGGGKKKKKEGKGVSMHCYEVDSLQKLWTRTVS